MYLIIFRVKINQLINFCKREKKRFRRNHLLKMKKKTLLAKWLDPRLTKKKTKTN